MDNKGDDQAAVLTNPRRARFESLGVDIVRADLARRDGMQIGGPNAREAARQWLVEKDAESVARQWRAEKDAERRADTRGDRRRPRFGLFLSGGALLFFLGWLIWVAFR